MQPRSKSTQERRLEREQQVLHLRLDWLSHQYRPIPAPPALHTATHPHPQHSSRQLHPLPSQPVQMVESFENTELVKMRTAIGELQALATSNENEGQNMEWTAVPQRREANAQSLLYEERQKPSQFLPQVQESTDGQNQTVQYYRCENDSLKFQLKMQVAKNSECLAIIKKLEHTNQQLQREITVLLQKYQAYQSPEEQTQKIKQLQQEVRQQLVINLKLEELLLKTRLKQENQQLQIIPLPQQEVAHLKNTIKELRLEMIELKGKNKKEIDCLLRTIEDKNQEIGTLRQSLELNEDKQEYKAITFQKIQSPTFAPMSSPPLLPNKLENHPPQLHYFNSTNPSLQDVPTLESDNRKKSDSVSSKGQHCLNFTVPNLQLRGNFRASKTDRH